MADAAPLDADILSYDMFAGDETDVTLLSNRMLITRTAHRCVICNELIPVGSRVRATTERNNEERRVMTFYACVPCCAAMARAYEDDGESIEQRSALGIVGMRAANPNRHEAAHG